MQKVRFVFFLCLALLLQSCMADLRPAIIKKEGITRENEVKGKKILEAAWKTQGFDHLQDFEAYSFKASDNWKGMMGSLGKPWPNAKSNMIFKFEIGSFDGQVNYLDGKKANSFAGLQSWNYYEYKEGEKAQQHKMNKRVRFGISAYQYFFEMLDRMKKAPLISWAGTEKFNGEDYEVLFVTWQKIDPHMQNDQ